MHLEVEENPNCEPSALQVFQELGPPKALKKIRLEVEGKPTLCWVAGIDKDSKLCVAWAQKVADSGAGVSTLVYGGRWGVRFKPVTHEKEPWDLQNPNQWGEPYLFYGDEKGLVYA